MRFFSFDAYFGKFTDADLFEQACTWIILFLVIAFVRSGFEHCFANIGRFTCVLILGITNLGVQMFCNAFIANIVDILDGSLILLYPSSFYFHHSINNTCT